MEAVMDDALKRKLLSLERQFWQALKKHDVEAALELTADPCIVTGAQGIARIDKKTFAGMMKSDSSEIDDFEITDVEFEQLSDDVAVIGYKVREELTVEGEQLTLEAADTSTWVRKNGSWVCALHTESITGDPYGRDRMQETAFA
jgi:hypothetical protein